MLVAVIGGNAVAHAVRSTDRARGPCLHQDQVAPVGGGGVHRGQLRRGSVSDLQVVGVGAHGAESEPVAHHP